VQLPFRAERDDAVPCDDRRSARAFVEAEIAPVRASSASTTSSSRRRWNRISVSPATTGPANPTPIGFCHTVRGPPAGHFVLSGGPV
jgi:hypothetical protein